MIWMWRFSSIHKFWIPTFCASPLMFCWVVCVICQYAGRIIIWFLGVKGFQNVLGVGTCFQVDLLVVYDYYSMWNPKWKAMCFCVCAFIIAVNMGVIIGVVNGWAQAKVIMKSWSPNRSCLTLDLPRHIN